MIAGKIISVSELNVEILLNNAPVKKRDVLYVEEGGRRRRFEVAELEGSIATAVPFDSVFGLKKGMDVEKEEEGLSVEYSDQVLGRVFNSYGNLIDGTVIENPSRKSVYREPLRLSDVEINGDILWTFSPPCKKDLKWAF